MNPVARTGKTNTVVNWSFDRLVVADLFNSPLEKTGMSSPGVAFAFALNGFILIALVLIYGYWRVTRSDGALESEGEPIEDWCEEATSLAREIQQTAEISEPLVDHDRVQRRLLPLSGRLKGHARAAPIEVEVTLVNDLHELGINCYIVGMEHTTFEAARTGVFLEDKLNELKTSAEEFESAVSSDRS